MEILKADNVSKIYSNGNVCFSALNHIQLNVQKGEFVAILGRSGSGKSTLLNLLAGLDNPTEGVITIDGDDIITLSESEKTSLRRKKLGFVFQSYELIPVLNVLDNIKLPQLEEDDEYLHELLDDLEISDYEKHYPDQLSGGQQQRVGIARALINRPSIVLADEPTGNLDSKTERKVMELLKKLVKKFDMSILLVTHSERLVDDVDRVIYLEDGEIIHE